jgi:carbon storage regulator
MLVLSRKRDESIMIGDHIRVTVTRITEDVVRLGIEAPDHVPIHRMEVWKAIQAAAAARRQDDGEDA